MKKICIVPMSPRTMSTYFTFFVHQHMKPNTINLHEFFFDHTMYLPYCKTKNKNFYLSTDNINCKLYKDINKKLEDEYDLWKYDYVIRKFHLDKNFKIIKTEGTSLNYDSHKRTFRNYIDIIINSKQSLVFKLFPSHVFRFKKFNNMLLELKDHVQIVFLERENILDACVSSVLALNSKIFNLRIKEHKYIFDKNENIICNQNHIDWIINSIKKYLIIKKQLNEKDYITIYDNELFNEKKIIEKLDLDIKINNKKNSFTPVKLYPNYTTEDRINLIKNKDEFWKFYEKGLKSLLGE